MVPSAPVAARRVVVAGLVVALVPVPLAPLALAPGALAPLALAGPFALAPVTLALPLAPLLVAAPAPVIRLGGRARRDASTGREAECNHGGGDRGAQLGHHGFPPFPPDWTLVSG